jgi:hypothetical protein
MGGMQSIGQFGGDLDGTRLVDLAGVNRGGECLALDKGRRDEHAIAIVDGVVNRHNVWVA